VKTLTALIKRNTSLFFKDKGMFFTAMITPLILLVLYATFLGNIYEESFLQVITEAGLSVDSKLLKGCVGGQLVSSLPSVSCITVAFCSNLLSVQDKVTGARTDLTVSPLKPAVLSLSYYVATLISTLIICYVALFAGLIYVKYVGWYMSFKDILFLIADVFLLSLFGTAFSSVVNHFLSSQGQISAVSSIISACYGFICGAYMPVSSFSNGLQKVLSFLPCTYATTLLRKHSLNGVFLEMENVLPKEIIDGMKGAVDFNISFFDKNVDTKYMYLIIAVWSFVLMITYVLMNLKRSRV